MRQQMTSLTNPNKEAGQSIVIIAAVMVALLAFVGLAVDLGLVWVRSAQLTAAVDAAALAGVTEIETQYGLSGAITKAEQFLYSNNIPSNVIISGTQYVPGSNVIGATEFTVTSTWPVELYFMRLLTFEEFTITRSATAAYFPLVDIYASRRVELGTLGTSNQAVFGPGCRTSSGDPFSPNTSVFRPPNHYVNPDYSNNFFTYRYRIVIPANYEATSGTNIVRVELFDPDTYNWSINQADNENGATHVITTTAGTTTARACGTNGAAANDRYRTEPCIIPTGENQNANPFWFIRIDEIRQNTGSSCITPVNNVYTDGQPTTTSFDLFYYRTNTTTGIIERFPLAKYVGRADNAHCTDMRWVSPGGANSYDQNEPGCPAQVPVNSGSSFEVNLQTYADILRDQNNTRYLYLDVTTINGASENGYEIWAGPEYYASNPPDTDPLTAPCGPQLAGTPPPGTPSKANTRNLHVVKCGNTSHSSKGVTVMAMGNLPMNSNTSVAVDIPLIYVGPEYGGSTISISMFDPDAGSNSPVVFYLDTVAFTLVDPVPAAPADPVNHNLTDWFRAFAVGYTRSNDPDLAPGEERNCVPHPSGSYEFTCNNKWVTPAYRIQVPTLDPVRCVNPATTPQWCTPFYGGRLIARYAAGNHDTYGWQIRMPGLPYIVR
jgi:hypothetical protein